MLQGGPSRFAAGMARAHQAACQRALQARTCAHKPHQRRILLQPLQVVGTCGRRQQLNEGEQRVLAAWQACAQLCNSGSACAKAAARAQQQQQRRRHCSSRAEAGQRWHRSRAAQAPQQGSAGTAVWRRQRHISSTGDCGAAPRPRHRSHRPHDFPSGLEHPGGLHEEHLGEPLNAGREGGAVGATQGEGWPG